MSKSASIVEDDTVENKSMIPIQNTSSQGLTVFPKNNITLIVQPHKHDKDNIKHEFNHSRVEIATRKPLMVKMVPKFKTHWVKTTESVTRRPLMKLRTYTVGMRSKGRDEMIHRDRHFSKNSSNSAKITFKEQNDTEKLDKVNTNKDNVRRKISRDIKQYFQEINDTDKFSKQEDLDRNEFIFSENKNEDAMRKDFFNILEEDFETTTYYMVPETKIRRKRYSL